MGAVGIGRQRAGRAAVQMVGVVVLHREAGADIGIGPHPHQHARLQEELAPGVVFLVGVVDGAVVADAPVRGWHVEHGAGDHQAVAVVSEEGGVVHAQPDRAAGGDKAVQGQRGHLRVRRGIGRLVQADRRHADAQAHFRVVEGAGQHAPVHAMAQVNLPGCAQPRQQAVEPAGLVGLRRGAQAQRGQQQRQRERAAYRCGHGAGMVRALVRSAGIRWRSRCCGCSRSLLPARRLRTC
ncbi:hypothetical protein D3C72_1171030 [compost metagenome]